MTDEAVITVDPDVPRVASPAELYQRLLQGATSDRAVLLNWGEPDSKIPSRDAPALLDVAVAPGFDVPPGEPTVATVEDLMTPRDTLVLLGHGDGAHLHLGFAIICGRVGEVERIAGRPVAGGCSEAGGCKKASTGTTPVVVARDLRARVLVVLSCHSLKHHGWLFPSDVSLAHSALSGYAEWVVGFPLAVETSFEDFRDLRASASGQSDMRAWLSRFNLLRQQRGLEGLVAAAGIGPAGHQGSDDDRLPVDFGRTTRSRTDRVSSDHTNAARLTSALAVTLPATGGTKALLDGVAEALRQLERERARAAYHQAGRVPCETDTVGSALDRFHRRVLKLVDRELLSEDPASGVGDALFSRLIGGRQATDHVWSGHTCTQCFGRLRATRYVDHSGWFRPIEALLCCNCGIHSVPGPQSLRMRVAAEPESNQIELRVDTGAEHLGLLQIRDKSAHNKSFQTALRIPRGSSISHIPIPWEPGIDLWSVRLISAAKGGLNYERRVVAWLSSTAG